MGLIFIAVKMAVQTIAMIMETVEGSKKAGGVTAETVGKVKHVIWQWKHPVQIFWIMTMVCVNCINL